VIYAIGDNLKVTTFVEDFVEYEGLTVIGARDK